MTHFFDQSDFCPKSNLSLEREQKKVFSDTGRACWSLERRNFGKELKVSTFSKMSGFGDDIQKYGAEIFKKNSLLLHSTSTEISFQPRNKKKKWSNLPFMVRTPAWSPHRTFLAHMKWNASRSYTEFCISATKKLLNLIFEFFEFQLLVKESFAGVFAISRSQHVLSDKMEKFDYSGYNRTLLASSRYRP